MDQSASERKFENETLIFDQVGADSDLYLAVWLNSNMQNVKQVIISKTKFCRIYDYLHIFNQTEDCEQFIRTVCDKKVFLMTTTDLGKLIVPRLHSHKQLHSIYLYSPTSNDIDDGWRQLYEKVKSQFRCDKQCIHYVFPYVHQSVLPVM
jgi:hypothetical protein